MPIAFVAGGPGDPELVSVRGADLLGKADLILADQQASDIVARHGNRHAEVILMSQADSDESANKEAVVSKSADASDDDTAKTDTEESTTTPAARARIMVQAARDGRRVVRLFTGDPVFDGRISPEVSAVVRSKVPFDVVVGASPVTAVPAYAGIPLLGGATKDVHIIDASQSIDYAMHGQKRSTIVVVDAGDRAVEIVKGLAAAGRDVRTPVALVRGGTTVEQRAIITTLEEFPAQYRNSRGLGNEASTILIVGEVVTQRERLSWFESKPLFGWRVLVPRTREKSGPTSSYLVSYGAVPVEVATIAVEKPRTPHQMDRAVTGLVNGRYQWVVFTSANSVRAVREKFGEYGLDARAFAGLKIAAMDDETMEALHDSGIHPDLMPKGEQSSAGLLEVWEEHAGSADPINKVFVPRADIATDTLVEGLKALGWDVEDITAYRTVRAAPPPIETREAIKSGGFDAVVFTSSSTVRNLVGLAGKPHASTVVAVIGPQTAKTAEEHGLTVTVVAEEPTESSLADALAMHASSNQSLPQDGE